MCGSGISKPIFKLPTFLAGSFFFLSHSVLPHTQKQKGMGCNLMVEHLPSIHEALGSTQRTKERERERKKMRGEQGSLNKPKYVFGV